MFTVPGAGLGITGAALGTVLAECVIAGAMMWYLVRRQPDLMLRGEEAQVISSDANGACACCAYRYAHDGRTYHFLRSSDYDNGDCGAARCGGNRGKCFRSYG